MASQSYASHDIAVDRQLLQNTFFLRFLVLSKYKKNRHASKGQREDKRLFLGNFSILIIISLGSQTKTVDTV